MEIVVLPLMVLLVDAEAVGVLDTVIVLVEDEDPVSVSVSSEEHDIAGDDDGLFDSISVWVEIAVSSVVCV
jgi:hypothetical protein